MSVEADRSSFSQGDFERLIDVYVSEFVDVMKRNGDAGGNSSAPSLATKFNDPSFLAKGSNGGLNGRPEMRSEEVLREKFEELRRAFADSHRSWASQAANDVSRFPEFAGGNAVLMYLFERMLQTPELSTTLVNASSPFMAQSPQPSPSAPRKRRSSHFDEDLAAQLEASHESFYAWLERIDGFIEEEKLASWPMALEAANRIRDTQQREGYSTSRIDVAIGEIKSRISQALDRRK
eukprot:CAMPEP_0113965278 /NCGR_PEP_ID=MMETSP0011_2-20120614/7653_1 /TAXON_ID=101924 /ORGANISM="Rhodosorus marinus" /LENGTH=235 /DNA_ID=CAMNT_0000977767 /DNA_START=452 /DNA_END=1159 /DNA_ORIENTATION=- /assembly_acc=CAM_ASM_000156